MSRRQISPDLAVVLDEVRGLVRAEFAGAMEEVRALKALLLETHRRAKKPRSIAEWCEERGISRTTFYTLNLPYAKVLNRAIPTEETDRAWDALLAEKRV